MTVAADWISRGALRLIFNVGGLTQRWRLSLTNHPKGPGSIDGVTIENVHIIGHHKTTPSNTITGIPGGRIKNITLKNIQIEMPGGLAKIPQPPKELPGVYPQSNIFGNTPAYGFYVRHADNIKFENITIGFLKPDARPWLATEDADVKTTDIHDLKEIKPAPIPGPKSQ